jgi:hypothetical protein
MTQAECVLSTPATNTSATNPVDPTRRGFITLAAGAPASSASAASPRLPCRSLPLSRQRQRQLPDPIYAAIDAHRKANAVHLAALKAAEGLTDWGITEQPCHDENDAFELLIGGRTGRAAAEN